MVYKARGHIVLFVNNQRYEVHNKAMFTPLSNFLRYDLKLCGTKVVCAEGDCGACSVLWYRPRKGDEERLVPVNSCIAQVYQFDGCHILTVESLKENDALSPVQQAMIKHHASQCGFCTPGFAIAITALFEEKPEVVSAQKIKNCLTGNLCRCTGYQPLIDAALSIKPEAINPLGERYLTKSLTDELAKIRQSLVHVMGDSWEFFAPTNLDDAVRFKTRHPHTRIIGGGTDLGVALNKGKITIDRVMSLHLIDELFLISEAHGRVVVGACASLAELRRFTKTKIAAFSSFLNIFASPQIKNIATLVGNVANGSPIGDTLPFLMITDAHIHVCGKNGSRIVHIEDFYQGYKTTSLAPDEIITHVSFAIPRTHQKLTLNKVSQRRDLDIATVNTGFMFEVDRQSNIIREARLAVGGVSSVVMRLNQTESFLCGQSLSQKTIDKAAIIIQNEITPLSDLRGSMTYRRAVVEGLFRKYCHEVSDEFSSP